MKTRQSLLTGTLVLSLLFVGNAEASWRWGTCDKAKLAITTNYIKCRINVVNDAAEKRALPDFTKCQRRFLSRWERLEYSRLCDFTGTVEPVKSISDKVAADLARAIIGFVPGECGNGVLEQGEECDLNDFGDATCQTMGFDLGTLSCNENCTVDTSTCENEPPPTLTLTTPDNPPRPYGRVFVTSLGYLGDLGGIEGADAICNRVAHAAGLGGSWVAWLSTPEQNAWERIPDTEYRRIDDVLVAENLADLTDGSIANPINVTEVGTTVSKYVWTGTGPDGNYPSYARDNCSNWTNGWDTGTARVGHTGATDYRWTNKTRAFCDLGYPNPSLYCFEL